MKKLTLMMAALVLCTGVAISTSPAATARVGDRPDDSSKNHYNACRMFQHYYDLTAVDLDQAVKALKSLPPGSPQAAVWQRRIQGFLAILEDLARDWADLCRHFGSINKTACRIEGQDPLGPVEWGILGGERGGRAGVFPGDFDGDGKDDLVILGGPGDEVWMATSKGDGHVEVTHHYNATLTQAARTQGIKRVIGDFDGDGRDDIAMLGGNPVGGSPWTNAMIWRSTGSTPGRFTPTGFAWGHYNGFTDSWAHEDNVKAVAGDFNGDGADDIALTGARHWTTIPVAYSNRDLTFTVHNKPLPTWPSMAADEDARVHLGDFDGDGDDDLTLTGPLDWEYAPIALSLRDGSFTTGSPSFAMTDFMKRVAVRGDGKDAQVVVADVDHDGRDDLNATATRVGGVPEVHGYIRTAHGTAAGRFNLDAGASWLRGPIENIDGEDVATDIPEVLVMYFWENGAQAVAGDFNGDGLDDLAVAGAEGQTTLPIAFQHPTAEAHTFHATHTNHRIE